MKSRTEYENQAPDHIIAVPDYAGTEADDDVPVEPKAKTVRIASLDVFRGLTVAVMILVDDAGGEWPRINHSPWDGCTLADFVMPFFLFIVGVAIALALKKIPRKTPATKKVAFRFGKLVFWGLLLQGGYSHAPDKLSYGADLKQFRWCGILQRIALSYLVVSLVEIASTKTSEQRSLDTPKAFFKIFWLYKWHWIAGALVIMVYHSVAYGLVVPDWHFINSKGERLTVVCGTTGDIRPACNAVGHVDRTVLGINHLYKHPAWRRTEACDINSPADGHAPPNAPAWCQAPFEPEGVLSSISAILSCTVGVHYGHVLIHYKDHVKRLLHWLTSAVILLVVGVTLHFAGVVPLNKQLYSFSYVCFTAGAAGMVFSAFYVLVDVLKIRRPTVLLQWMGMNAMLVFVMAASDIFDGAINGFYWDKPNNNLVNWIRAHIFVKVWHSERVGTLLFVIFAKILFWALVCGFLHQQHLYWKL